MVKYFILSAISFWKKNKVFLFINTLCLSAALSVSFIIILYEVNEFSYDSLFKNKTRIYRVINYYSDYNEQFTYTPYVLSQSLKAEFPQVEKAASCRTVDIKLSVNNSKIDLPETVATTSEIFDIFNIPILNGSLNEKNLENLNCIFISKQISDRIFPRENPLGKEVKVLLKNKEYPFLSFQWI